MLPTCWTFLVISFLKAKESCNSFNHSFSSGNPRNSSPLIKAPAMSWKIYIHTSRNSSSHVYNCAHTQAPQSARKASGSPIFWYWKSGWEQGYIMSPTFHFADVILIRTPIFMKQPLFQLVGCHVGWKPWWSPPIPYKWNHKMMHTITLSPP